MAAQTETSRETGFGEVSRLRGVLFKYLTLAASLFGIVALTILLVYVSIDAFGLDQADPAWYLVYLVTLVAPTGAVAWYGLRNRPFGRVGAGVTGRLAGGVALGTAAAVLFTILDPQLWVLVYTVGVLPTVGVLAYGRLYEDPRANLWALGVVVVGTAVGVFLKGPIDTFPTQWLIYLWTLAVPVAAAVGYRRVAAGESRNRALLWAGGVLAVAGGGSFGVGLATSLKPTTGLLFVLTAVVPTALYVDRVLAREEGRLGLLAPVVVAGGAVLGWLIVDLLGVAKPQPWLDWQFVTSAPSQFPEQAGLYPAIIGSVFIISLVAVITFVLGVATAIFLEEYAPSTGWLGSFTRFVQVNISNLAGVPSVVYGLLGLGLFVNLAGFGLGIVLVAAITLSLLILPIVIISAQEAIRSVPDSMRQASYGMGATRWQTVRTVVLPEALPGIFTGTILALGRAIGETAPLILIGLPNVIFNAPDGLFSKTTAMPMQIYVWATLPKAEFRYGVVAAGVVTLLAVLLSMNSVAILLRNKYQ